MAYQITKEDVWSGDVADRPGGLAEKLEPLANAGVDLGFMISRRAPDLPGLLGPEISLVPGHRQRFSVVPFGQSRSPGIQHVTGQVVQEDSLPVAFAESSGQGRWYTSSCWQGALTCRYSTKIGVRGPANQRIVPKYQDEVQNSVS